AAAATGPRRARSSCGATCAARGRRRATRPHSPSGALRALPCNAGYANGGTMPRRFFRRFTWKRHRFHGRWWLAPFEPLLHDPRLWGIRRRNVVPGTALGTFIACLPLPGPMLFAALGAILLRIHVPAAALVTLVTNPLTMGPLFYLEYRIGQHLLGLGPRPFAFEPSLEWLTGSFLAVWQPLLLGAVLLGAVAAALVYVVLDLLWRAAIADYLEKRRQRRR